MSQALQYLKPWPNYQLQLRSPFRFPHSAIPIPHSPSRIPHPAFPIPHSPLPIPHSAFPIPHSPSRIPHSTFPIPHSPSRIPHPTFPIPHSPFRIPHPAFPIPHSPFRIPLPRSPFRVPPSAFPIPHSTFRYPPFAFPLPPTPFRIPPSAFPLPHSPFRIHPSAFTLPHSPFRIPPSAFPFRVPASVFPLPHSPFRLPASAFPLPHSPFCPPPSAFPLPPSPFRIPPSAFPLPHPPLRILPSTFPLPHYPFRIPPFSPPCLMFPPILSPCFPHTAGPSLGYECIAAHSSMWSAHQQRNHSVRILLLTFACHILFSHPTLPFQGAKVSASLRTATCGVLTSKGTWFLTTLLLSHSHPLFPPSPSLPMLGGECIAAHSNVRSAQQQRDLLARTLLLTFATHILFSLPPLPFQGAKVSASLRTATCGVLTSKGTWFLTTLLLSHSHPLFPPSPSLPMLGGECIAAHSNVRSAQQQRDLLARTLLLTFATHILFSLPPLPLQGAVVRASLRTAVCEVHASKGASV
ncbi:unnamed protein product [Closterium sp. Naga37s-1]|nr:unnamed protein product [Closterium sp. Naga37s-1]